MRFRILFLIIGAGSITGTFLGVWEVYRQVYLRHGFYRNASLTISGLSNDAVLVSLALVAAFLLLDLLSRLSFRNRIGSPSAFGFACAIAGALLIRFGWIRNRYTFSQTWKTKQELLGFDLPGGFLDSTVVFTNLLIVLCCVLIGVVLYFGLCFAARFGKDSRIVPVARRISTIITVAGLLLLLTVNTFGLVGFRAGEVPGPNVILISLDTLRADFLECYGYERSTSPALKELADESILFEHAYSQAPNTFPSHASFLTSRYPSVNHTQALGSKLPPWRIVCAEIFREAGYRTCGIVDATFLSGRFGLDQGYDDFIGWGRRARNIIPRAIEWLERHGEKPFFLFVHIYDIHSPYARLPEYREMFVDPEYRGDIQNRLADLGVHCRCTALGKDPGVTIDKEDTECLKALYSGGIRYTDDLLGRLLDFVCDGEIGENTIIALVADHGEEFMEHGSVLHAKLYRSVTHVPLILRLPGGERGGRRIDHPVGLIDLLPTLLDFTGIESSVPMSGHSLMSLALGEDDISKPFVFSEFDDIDYHLSVITPELHLVVREREGSYELFRYRDDPFEQKNIIQKAPLLADSLKNLLQTWRIEIQKEKEVESDMMVEVTPLDRETIEELRALGYIE